MDDATSIATSDNRSSVGAQSVLARDWTVTAHEVCYATGEGKLLLDEVTAVIPGSSACALVGPSVADKGALLRLLGGAARGGYFSGRVAFGGQPHHEASLLCVFAEAPPGGEGEARSLLGGGGGGRVEGSLSPAEAVAFAAALRFGADAPDARDRGATMARAGARRRRAAGAAAAKGHRFARGAASRAEAVVARRRWRSTAAGDLRRGPVPGLAGGECLVVAGALEALAARGHTVIASLDSDGLSEAAFEAALAVGRPAQRRVYCGETRRAAAHCARCFADGDGARFGRLDVLERVGGDARLAAACARSFARTPESRRAEQEAAHVEPLDEERGALHWLAPPVVAPAARFRTLVYRDLAPRAALHLPPPRRLRDRRAGKYGALEHVAARSALLVLESACVAVAPTALYLMAGLPFGCCAFVYALGALLAFACGCCIEALAAWAHSPPPADARGGGGGDFAPDRAAAAAADRVTCGAFGALASCMVLSTGFGVELNDFRRGNPFFWHARANHLRWYVQGVALRVRRQRYHDGGGAAAGGWRRYAAVDSLWALLALAAAARLASYYYLTLRPPSARHVDAKKLATWATRPKLDADDAAEALDAAAKNPLGLARDKGAVAVPPRVAPERSNERSAARSSRRPTARATSSSRSTARSSGAPPGLRRPAAARLRRARLRGDAAGSADAARVADATLRPLDAALENDLKLLAAPASAGPGGPLKTPEEAEPMGAAAILRPTFRVGVLAQAAALLRRDLAAARADRGMLGAAIGAPLANAALLCGAFWGRATTTRAACSG
ncbi:ATPase [Aureococcus anophagefferens]|nr:ATPase [Aureococcus anophagefferens]